MEKYFWRQLGVCFVVIVLSSCAEISTVPREKEGTDKAWLYDLKFWSFSGRLAIAAPNDSWTANVNWLHRDNAEKVKLSGPLGQGAVAVRLYDGTVTIDRGSGPVQTSNDAERFIQQQLGMFVPINSLRFWAIGIPEPQQDFQNTASGFVQSGWLVDYREMQRVGSRTLPYKLAISKDRVKLKLVVEKWDITDTNGN